MCFHLSSKMQTYPQPDPTMFPINSYPLFPPRSKYYPAFGTFLSSSVLLSPLIRLIPPSPKQWNVPLPIRSSVTDNKKDPETNAPKEIKDANNVISPTSVTLSVVSPRPLTLSDDEQDVREQVSDVGQGNRVPANNSTARPEVKNATTDDNFSLQDFIIQDTACSRSDCHNYLHFCLIYRIKSVHFPWLHLKSLSTFAWTCVLQDWKWVDFDRKLDFKTEDSSSVLDKSTEGNKKFNVVDGFFIPKKSVTYKEDKVNYSNSETIRNSSETFSSSSVSSIINQSKYSITSPLVTLFTKTNSGSFRPEFTTFSSDSSSLDWTSSDLSTEEVFFSLYIMNVSIYYPYRGYFLCLTN